MHWCLKYVCYKCSDWPVPMQQLLISPSTFEFGANKKVGAMRMRGCTGVAPLPHVRARMHAPRQSPKRKCSYVSH